MSRIHTQIHARARRPKAPRAIAVLTALGLVAASAALSASTATATAVDPVPGALTGGDSLIIHQGNGGYDVQHYDIDLTYFKATGEQTRGTIDATATITARALIPLSSFGLDFKGLDVDAVTVNGTPAAATQRIVNPDLDQFKLVVTPAAPVEPGPLTVVVEYSGTPEGYTYRGSGSYIEGWLPSTSFTAGGTARAADGGATGIGQPVGSITWFPNNDVPTDKATYTTSLTVPREFRGVGIGQLLSETAVGPTHTRFVWDEPVPTATFLTIAAIGEFNEYRDSHTTPGGQTVPIVIDTDPHLDAAQNNGGTAHLIDLTKQLLDWGEARFGRYQPSVAGYVQKAIGANYALEIFGKPFYNGNISESTFIHEFTHQWSGDSVGVKDWTDLWLAEGFATFAPWLWTEDHGGQTTTARTRNTWATTAATNALWRVAPARLIDKSNLWGTSSYNGGALVFGALRAGVGDDAFFEILKTWFARYANSNASTEDFIDVAEEVSGVDLSDFATEWLYQPGKPAAWPGDEPFAPPALTLSETEVGPGWPLTVSGTGFASDRGGELYLDGSATASAAFTTDGEHGFSQTILLPEHLAQGAHSVTARVGNLTAEAQFEVGDAPYADLALLAVAIDSFEAYERQARAYTPASYAPLAQALTDARALLAGPPPAVAQINAAIAALHLAADGLVLAVDASPLAHLVAQAEAILANPSLHVSASLAALGAAIGQAQAVLDNPDRTQAQVLAAAGVVQDALAQVVARGDTRPLRALAGFARNLKQSDFTPGTWSAVATALTAADTVLAAPEPAADAVDAAYAGLRDAIGGLALRANKTALETALALATAVLARADQYAPASVAGLAEAAAVASAVFADDDATQTAVDAAVGDVVTRVAAARLKPAPPAAASVAGGADQASAGTAAVAKASKASKASAKAAVTLARRSVKAGAKAKVTVRLKAAGGAVPTGKVVLKVAGKSKTVVFKARHQGERTVTLPAVSKSGVYKVKVAYKGSASVAKASVAAKTLRVK